MTWRGKVLCSAGGFLFFLCLLELGARVAFPEWAPTRAERRFWVHDAQLGWRHTPNQSGRFTHPDFTISVSINSHGHRDREYAYERTAGKQRMLVLADSYGWGFGVEAAEMFHTLLEERHSDWEIINSSVSGYGTDQEYLYYLRDGARYEADIVLLLFNETDLHNNRYSVQHWHNKPRFRLDGDGLALVAEEVPEPSVVQRLDKQFFAHTYFLARVYGSIRSLLSGSGSSRGESGTPAEGRIELTARLVVALRDAVRERGARLVVVSAPFSDADLAQRWGARMEAESITYLPLDAAFERAGPESLLFEHDLHWNAHGHAVVAGELERQLFEGDLPD